MNSSNQLLSEIFALPDYASADNMDDPLPSAASNAASSRRRPSEQLNSTGSSVARRGSFMKADTLVTKFRSQLNALMDAIKVTEVQYVRCIKPNSLKSSKIFDRVMVVEQLRCAGMIEAIRITRAAYPYRISQIDFIKRFYSLKVYIYRYRYAFSAQSH
jgi:myosin heavy subunit